jgi:hypothetical protein
VVLQKFDEMLAHHAGGAEDADFDFGLHVIMLRISRKDAKEPAKGAKNARVYS